MDIQFRIAILDDRYYPNYDEERKVFDSINGQIINITSNKISDIITGCQDVDGIVVNLVSVTAEVIDSLGRCRVISRYGVGYDNVDVSAATAKGIWVANVPDYCGEDVSDQAFALFLSCVRKVAQRDKQVRTGIWNIRSTSPQRRIKGKTFVLCGYGMIARTLHRKLLGFELGRILVYDPYVDESVVKAAGAEKVDWQTALREGDYFSIHMPLNNETKGFFNEEVFQKMKPTAIVINTSRGQIVDQQALCRALKEGWIDSAGLDVFEKEPVDIGNPLLELENITVSGHTGFYTEESITELKTKAAQNVKDALVNGRPKYPVNKLP